MQHSIIFVASDDGIDEMELDENPADAFPVMSTLSFHREARAQLYSLITGDFLDDAIGLEVLYREMTDDGPFIYKLDRQLQERMSHLDEDEVAELSGHWLACEELESMDVGESDLYEFMYQYAHFCYTATNADDLDVFIYSDS